MFEYSAIRVAISADQVPSDEMGIGLPLLNEELRLGIGRDGYGAFVFVGPGQALGRALQGRLFSFEPWVGLVDNVSGVLLRDVCVLRFRPIDDAQVWDAVAAVFAGLVDLASATPDVLGEAIEAMEGLFESGLRSHVPRETEIGLAGELLVIAEAANPLGMARTWHSQAEGRFDFSTEGERLEVKTTSGAKRVHWFGSEQLTPIPGVCTTFVSIVLPLVETGSTVASLFAGFTALPSAERARVRNIIIDTAREPPELLTSLVFDRAAARSSLLHVSPQSVPLPTASPGVGRMRWEATISAPTAPPGACRFARDFGS